MPIGKITTGVITDSAVTEAKLGAGTSSGTAVTQWHVDNLTFNSNQLSTSGTQDLILFPDTAQVGINTSSPSATLDVNGTLQAGSMKIDNTTLSTVNTNENLVISPNGSGNVEVTSVLQVDAITSNDSSSLSFNTPIEGTTAGLDSIFVDAINTRDSSRVTFNTAIEVNSNIDTNTISVDQITARDSSAVRFESDVEFTGDVRAGGIQFSNSKIIPLDSTSIDVDSYKITNLATPTEEQDAATKKYVDDNAGSITTLDNVGNIDAPEANILDGDILVSPLTDSSTHAGFSLASQTNSGLRLPSGTTAQRPTAYVGNLRVNTTLNTLETSIDGSTFEEVLTTKIIENTDVDSATEQIDSFNATTFRTAKYIYQITNSGAGEYQSGEILVTHNGSSAFFTEYAKLLTGNNDLITFTVGVSSGSVQLFGSARAPNSSIKLKRIMVTV
jgi:hypothetical protein